jgi:methionyl-tRNA formyltransferase
MGGILVCSRGDYSASKTIYKALSKTLDKTVMWAKDKIMMERISESEDIEWIVFPFWSWLIPETVIRKYKCISFHVGDLPKDRGGSPIQNQIMAGRKTSILTAFKTSREMDAGPIYMKKEISLEGDLEEIHERIGLLIPKMVDHIIKRKVEPQPQNGKPTYFERRKPEQSEIKPSNMTALEIYNLIRCLNMPPYPPAFIVGKDGKKVSILKAKLEE